MASSVHQNLTTSSRADTEGYRGSRCLAGVRPEFRRQGKEDHVTRSRRVHTRLWLVLMATLVARLVISLKTAQAEVPSGPPTFSHPLNINNPFFPFQPGGLKVYAGRAGGTKTKAIEHYLTATRTFSLNGQNVRCRILVEEAYEDGALVERSFNYFAQADDGTVYYFGEVVNIIARRHRQPRRKLARGRPDAPLRPARDRQGTQTRPVHARQPEAGRRVQAGRPVPDRGRDGRGRGR